MKNSIYIVLLLIYLSACSSGSNSNLDERKKKINAIENAALTDDQIERKKKSMEYCKLHDIPTLEQLTTAPEKDVEIRSKEEVINRILAICYIGLKSEGLEENHLADFEAKYGIREHFSPSELAYVDTTNPTQQQTINANWRYESMHVLLWSVGFIDSLKYPSELCNVADDVKLVFTRSREELMNDAKLRSKSEILDAADLIYRIDWSVTDARIKNKQAPSNLDGSVVYERHYALNWIINYMNQDWDDVSTDT
ncbi:MAG: DUF4272 domain-containing protein [bacterium]|nr:DUF4272 domain-containing protein [bacterium]